MGPSFNKVTGGRILWYKFIKNEEYTGLCAYITWDSPVKDHLGYMTSLERTEDFGKSILFNEVEAYKIAGLPLTELSIAKSTNIEKYRETLDTSKKRKMSSEEMAQYFFEKPCIKCPAINFCIKNYRPDKGTTHGRGCSAQFHEWAHTDVEVE
jgi:hypothetical protein